MQHNTANHLLALIRADLDPATWPAYRACGVNGTGFGASPLAAISDYLEIVPLVHMRV